MDNPSDTEHPPSTVIPSTPYPQGKIITCPLCGLDVTPKSMSFWRGICICLDCDRHCFPSQKARYLRAFYRWVPSMDTLIKTGLLFYTVVYPTTPDQSLNWLQYAPKSVVNWLLATPLVNLDWVERDRVFEHVLDEQHVASLCQSMADRDGVSVGGFHPRFTGVTLPTSTTTISRTRDGSLPFGSCEANLDR